MTDAQQVLGATPAGAPTPAAESQPEPTRRNTSQFGATDVYAILGSLAAGVSTTVLVSTTLFPITGSIGFTLISYLLFLGYYVLITTFEHGGTEVSNRVWSVIIYSAAVLLFIALALVIFFTLRRGSEAFLHWNFWTQDLSMAGPLDPLTVGGMAHAALGTLIMIFFALVICIPLGILCAVFLSEYPGRLSRFVRTVVEAMTALPSILCGLFIFSTYILMFGMPRSGFASSLAISIMILPIMIRSADTVLRLTPASLKEAAYALGSTRLHTVWTVVLPTNRSGLMTAIILGTARGIGETAPVLITAGYTPFLNTNPFNNQMVSLPLVTFTLVKSSIPNQVARGFGAAAVLMVVVLLLFLLGRRFGGAGAGVLTKRGMARAMRQSAAIEQRIDARNSLATGSTPAAAPAPTPGGSAHSLAELGYMAFNASDTAHNTVNNTDNSNTAHDTDNPTSSQGVQQ